MSETYSPAGNVSAATYRRATIAEAATGTFGDEFMRQDMTQIADRIRFLDDNGFPNVSKIMFPAVAVPSAGPNDLDDYEEGSWTPGISFGGASVGVTYVTQVGNYTKIGNRVYIDFTLTLSSKGSSVGAVNITGLPFASVGNGGAGIAHSTITTGVTGVVVGVFSASSAIIMRVHNNGGETGLLDTQCTNGSQFLMASQYKV
jgi:hypothetical protein